MLTSTKLGKHLATLTQILNLTKSELEQLADHLDHNLHVHKYYYSLPQEVVFLARVGKVLMATNQISLVINQIIDVINQIINVITQIINLIV
ncbi:hypothetical protein HOLleu_16693 [Holothuria leucospilota]|uniref:Uncharacterized protein n=1 Tax=Holothuria leucospilota TaxID=206669 RepID=A0A9Q1C6K7_HOLLE|nr:hypothetical protein HOLleu_16693 [Holothuria leucospilota]